MKTPVWGILALLTVVVLGTALPTAASAQEAPTKPAKESRLKVAKDYDGDLTATCNHPVDHELRQVKMKRKDKESRDILEDVTVNSEVSITCPVASELSAMSLVTTSALPPWRWWVCSGKNEYDTLLGMNYKLSVQQWFQTSPYTNVVWPPPNPTVTGNAGLGWKVDSATFQGPYQYSRSGSAVMSGLVLATGTYSYPVTWFNLATESNHLNLVFRYGACSWSK